MRHAAHNAQCTMYLWRSHKIKLRLVAFHAKHHKMSRRDNILVALGNLVTFHVTPRGKGVRPVTFYVKLL